MISVFSLLSLFASNAFAQTPDATPTGMATPTGPSLLVSFFPFIIIFVLFYVLLIMPQQKKAKQRKAMLAALKKGDRVMTSGGLLGTVTTLAPKVITLQVAEGTRIKFNRNYIEELISDEEGGEEKDK